MNTSMHFGPEDRGPDGKLLSIDQLLADSKQAMSAAPIDPPAAPTAKKSVSKAEQALAIVALPLLAIAVYWFSASPAAPVALNSAPSAPTAPAVQQTSAPTQIAPPAALLPAFSAPDAPLGQIEATRAITPVAHFGSDWIQANVQGSGRIWLRASDWPSLAIVGPDLAPPTPAPYVPPTATATPAPPPCAEAGVAGKMVQACGYDSLESLQAQAKEQWIATYGGNVGIVSTPTPQEWNRP